MNWYQELEQRKKLLVGGIILICITILAVTARRNNLSYDSFWHLQMGLDWLTKGLSPWVDHYSFTFNGQTIASPPYIFEALLALIVSVFGVNIGFQIYLFLSFVLVFLLLTLFLRMLKAPVAVYLVVLPMMMVLLQLRTIVRPEQISYSFSVLAIMLYYRARNGISAANMLPIIVLLLVWNNYHSPIIGYIIFFGYFIDQAILQFKNRAGAQQWFKWTVWGLAAIAVGFLTPGFDHPLIHLWNFSPEWKFYIQEYKSPLIYSVLVASYAILALAIVTLILLIKKRKIGLLIVAAILIGFASTMARLVTPSGIVILCIFSWVVSSYQWQPILHASSKKISLLIASSLLAMSLMSLYTAVTLARTYMLENRVTADIFAHDVVDYMRANKISGNIFNDYTQGGYLIYQLEGSIKVYIDGRTDILYPVPHFQIFDQSLANSDVLKKEIEKYKIKLALLPNQHKYYSLVDGTGKLELDYIGRKFSLFRREQANFPITGKLLANPACWQPSMRTDLLAEKKRAEIILPEKSFITLSYLPSILTYSAAIDKNQYIDKYNDSPSTADDLHRFFAYQALKHGLNASSQQLLVKIRAKSFADYLALGLATARDGHWIKSEQWLDQGTRVTSSTLAYELSILQILLEQIREHKGFDLFDDDYLEKITAAAHPAENNSTGLPVFNDFCPTAYAIN